MMKVYVSILLFIFILNARAQNLPNRIQCRHADSQYQLVLIFKSPQMPEGFTAFGLKNGNSVIFKVASQAFKDENNILNLMETPQRINSKLVKLDVLSKIAVLSNFHLNDLAEGSQFSCEF